MHRQLPGPAAHSNWMSAASCPSGSANPSATCARRSALLEGLGSCVLQLDEIEKGFGGVGGELDGGAAQRAFGIFLKWLSDRSCPVYVIATANNIKGVAGGVYP